MNLFRQIPQVDKLINLDVFEGFNKKLLIKKTKLVLQTLKQNIQNGKVVHVEVDKIIEDIKTEYLKVDEELIKSVVNATGVILHTNLGRSILSKELLKKVVHRLTRY